MEEIENLTQMLISPDTRNAELALELLQQQSHYIEGLVVPLTILTKLSKNEHLQALANVVLHLKYTTKIIREWEQPLEVFEAAQNAKILNWARFYKLLQYYEKNREFYEPILLNHPEYTPYFEGVAMALMRTFKQYQLAYVYFQKVREKPEFSLQAKFYLAEMIYRYFLPEGKYLEEAPKILEILRVVQTHRPPNAERFWHVMGTICELYTDDIEQAKAYYEQVLQIEPDFEQSSFNLARIYFVNEQNYIAAQAILKKLVAKHARNVDYWFLLAQVEWEGFHNLDQAEAIFQNILKLSRNKHPQTSMSLGDLYIQKGSYTDTLRYYKMALAQHPNDIQKLLKFADFQYHQLKDTAEASRFYNKVLDLDADNELAMNAIASIKG
ncbi:MAG: hypothetical protein GY810_30020 [Aureispira sp.]|nr:hypothetical protein [Aureispira sp.]